MQKSLLLVVICWLLLCGCAAPKPQAKSKNTNVENKNESVAVATQNDSPNAVAIGNLLKEKGIPLTYEVSDSTNTLEGIGGDNAKVGIISDAATATNIADISITVFDSVQHRNEARARVEKLGGTTYYAECGVIQVSFMPDNFTPNKEAERQAKKTLEILKATYGCK